MWCNDYTETGTRGLTDSVTVAYIRGRGCDSVNMLTHQNRGFPKSGQHGSLDEHENTEISKMSLQQKESSQSQESGVTFTRDARGRTMQQTIAIVSAGAVTLPDGTIFQLDSEQGRDWLQSVPSFRFVPSLGHKPFTARRQPQNALWYWYGCRKMGGKSPKKKYIGVNTPEVITITRLEEVARELTDLEP